MHVKGSFRISAVACSVFLLACLGFTVAPPQVGGVELKMRWNPSPSAGVQGYRVYYGQSSRAYSDVVDAGQSTACSIGGLEDGRTYYLAVVAYGAFNEESDYSEEVVYCGVNIAAQAWVQASSESAATGQSALKAVDGANSRDSKDPKNDWVTQNESAGAWIQLSWSDIHEISRIVLYDRPAFTDQILRCTLYFSDGSSMAAGPLLNDGRGTSLSFPPKATNQITLVIEDTKGNRTGVSEIEVFANPSY